MCACFFLFVSHCISFNLYIMCIKIHSSFTTSLSFVRSACVCPSPSCCRPSIISTFISQSKRLCANVCFYSLFVVIFFFFCIVVKLLTKIHTRTGNINQLNKWAQTAIQSVRDKCVLGHILVTMCMISLVQKLNSVTHKI